MRPSVAHARILITAGFAVLIFSCTRKDDAGFRHFKIKEGKHSSSHGLSSFSGDELRFRAVFNQSAEYENADPVNQEDINKLYGFSDCSSQHHTNSARFGWRWFNSEIQVFAYCYANGERSFRQVGVAEKDLEFDYSILAAGDWYVFRMNDDTLHMPRGCEGNGGLKYKLYPYFGGDETAPHDIEILIKE